MKKRNLSNIFCVILFFAPAYLLRVSVFGVPTNILEILILGIFVLWILGAGDIKSRIFSAVIENGKHMFLIGVLFLGLIFSAYKGNNLIGSLGIIKGWFVIPLIFALMIFLEAKEEKEKRMILKSIYFSSIAVSAIALLYLIGGYLTFDGRLRAFWESPNHLGMYLCPGAILGVWMFFSEEAKGFKKIVEIIFLSPILLALYFTYSYAAWIALAISICILLCLQLRRSKEIIKVMGIIAGILFILCLSQVDSKKFSDLVTFDERSSLASRVMIWKASFKILSQEGVLGVGAGNFQEKYLEYQKYFPPYLEWAVPQPHNLLLAFWLQSGLLGLVGFLGLIYFWLCEAIRKIKRDAFNSIPIALLCLMAYIFLHGMVDTTYWRNDLSLIFWTIFALL